MGPVRQRTGIKTWQDRNTTRTTTKRNERKATNFEGGTHGTSNLVAACHSCNSLKHAKTFMEWMEEIQEPHKTRTIRSYKWKHGRDPSQMYTDKI
ncbi:MAG TPA: hypothetical protein EYG28_06355 [Nitrospiria bacterium]|nr:hypothetical protein [Candidatus Manganitrophaceae bacterium]HIL34994.1 hypothetical protein [Candidatus Manganitrophaceae bacterium]